MNRELKFRAWSYGKMRYIQTPNDLDLWNNGPTDGPQKKLSDIGLMQFTGLRDCMGKEIFEGDVWRVQMGKHFFDGKETTDYISGVVSISPIGVVIGVNPLWANSHIFGDRVGEIIGNIHENPELIP